MLKFSKSVSQFHGKSGPNKVFGMDVDSRVKFNPDQATQRFNEVWEQSMCNAVENATEIAFDLAKSRVPMNGQIYLKKDQIHKSFKLQNCEFIAQIHKTELCDELTQLWFIPSSDANPRAIFVEFGSVEERESFSEAATRHNWDDKELALKLLRDFISNTSQK